MKITAIPQLYRNLRRWREILAVLRRYGLADWLTRFRLPFRDSFTDNGGVPLSSYSSEQRVRMALTELGPTFIKLGQLLAARVDLVGPKLADELKKLRADVQADSIETVREMLAGELGGDYENHFSSIEPEPMATASIGQVHRAVLADGSPVVIKVQRTGIEKTVAQDVDVLVGVAQLAERVEALAAFSPTDMVRQLAPMITRELDFGRERQNLDFFGRCFDDESDRVVIPAPIDRLCTRRVLVMDELIGTPLSKFLPSGDPVPDPIQDTADRQTLCETIAASYLRMIFTESVFHADPHPGNLLWMEDGSLGILDFGMIGRIDDNLRETIEEMLLAISVGDQNRLTRLIRRIGDAPPTLDDSKLAIDVSEFVQTFGRQRLGEFDLTGALNELSVLLHRHSIKLPNQSALLLKMFVSLEGTLRELGAGFDSLEVVRKFMCRSLGKRLSPRRRLRQARRIYLEAENFLENAPEEMVGLLQQARRGEVNVRLEHHRIGKVTDRMVLGVMASAVFVGSSLMLAMKVPPLLFSSTSYLAMRDISVLGLAGIISSITVMTALTIRTWRTRD